jgi:hypothetical protein
MVPLLRDGLRPELRRVTGRFTARFPEPTKKLRRGCLKCEGACFFPSTERAKRSLHLKERS